MLKFVVLLTILTVAIASSLEQLSSMRAKNDRISSGEDTNIENVPYQVSIIQFGCHHCSGSIIAEQWILTAAHCVLKSAKSYKIRAESNKPGTGGSIHNVSEIIRHEDFELDGPRKMNNIALMRVEEPFKFDQTRKPIELFYDGEQLAPGSIAVITGWKMAFYEHPQTLQLVKVPIVPKEECHKIYEFFGGLPDNQICAAYPQDGKNTCLDDSGDPLTIDGRLAGVSSWDLSCSSTDYPSVYTEVAAYRKWIQSKIQL